MPIYESNGKRYNIPEEKVESFLKAKKGAKLVDSTPFYLSNQGPSANNTVIKQEDQPQQEQQQQQSVIDTSNLFAGKTSFDNVKPGISLKDTGTVGNIGLPQNQRISDAFKTMYDKGQLPTKNAAEKQTGFFATPIGDAIEKLGSGAVRLLSGLALSAKQPTSTLAPHEKLNTPEDPDAPTALQGWFGVADKLSEKGDRFGTMVDPETGEVRKKTYSDLWKEGKKGAAIGEVMLTATESLPTSLAAMIPYAGLPLVAMSAAGMKYQELDSNPDLKGMDEWKKILNASVSGAVEGLTEKLGAKVDVKIFEPLLKNITEETVKKTLAKGGVNMLIQALMEGGEEILSGFGSNSMDYLTGVTDEYKPFEGAKDQFVYGMGGGVQFGAMTGAGTVYRATEVAQRNRNLRKAERAASKYFPNWQAMKANIEQSTIAEREASVIDLQAVNDMPLEARKAYADYIKAKNEVDVQTLRREQYKQQEVVQMQNRANSIIDSVVNPQTNSIIIANVPGAKEVRVYGDIVLNADGTIDEKQSKNVYYTDAEGKRHVVSPKFVEIIENTPADQAKQELIEITTTEIKNRQANEEVRPYDPGEIITFSTDGAVSLLGQIVSRNEDGTYQVLVEGMPAPVRIEPRMIVPEDNIKGIENGMQVQYRDEQGNIHTGIVNDAFSLRTQGLIDIDGNMVKVSDIIPLDEMLELQAENEGAVPEQIEQNDSKTPETEAKSQLTPEQQAEAEKQQFLESLPVVESGKRKGQIDQSQMTPEQNIKYFEYQYGQDKAIEASQKMVQILNKKIASEQKKLDNDPFNIELNENIQAMQGQLQAYKAYVDAQQQQQQEPQQQQEQQQQEQEQQEPQQQEQEQQQQEQEVEQRDEQGVQIEKEQKLTPEEKAKLRREQKERLAKQKKELRAQRRAEAKALAEEERLRIEKEIEAEQNDPNLSKAEKEIRMLMRQADAEKEELRNKFRNAKPSERESLWGDVQSLREHIMRELIKGQKILWGDSNGSKGFAYHLGLKGSETERRKYIGLLGSAQKTNAKTPEQFAHDIWEDVASSETDQFFGVDTMEILDEVLDVLYTHTSKGQMIKAINSARLDDAFAQIDSEVNMAINYLESMQEESLIDDEELYGEYAPNEIGNANRDISDEEYDLYYKNQITYEEFEEQIRNFKENFNDNGYEEELGSDREVVEQGSEAPIGEGRDQNMLSSEEDQGESYKVSESQAEGRVESSEAVRHREANQKRESENSQANTARNEGSVREADNQRGQEQRSPIDIVKEAQQAVEKYKQESYKKEASRLSEMFGVDVEMHENLDGVSEDVRKQIESGGRTPGWYQNGKAHIYLPHTISVKDLQETFFHEVIAHKGLRELLGDRFNDVMLDFFDKLPKEVQEQLLSRYKSFDVYANKTDQELKVIAADEFIANVAENGEFMGVDQRTVLQRIIDAIKKFFNANNIEVRLADVERLANDYLRQSAERLEQNANRSVNNTNNNKNEEAPHYRTKNGRQLQFNFLSDQEIQDQRGEANNTGTRSDDIQREKDPFENKLGRLKPGEFSYVERVFTEKAHFDFTGSDKIETVEDVVSIFDKLEDSAVENSFVVYEKNGRATVQHLGMGSFSQAQVNVPAMVEGARRIEPDKIYFVHNHPTGTLIASNPDTVIYKALKNIFGDKLQDGIIINLKTGKYGIFNDNISESRNKTDKKGDVPVRVFSFDKIVFDKNHYPENLAKIQSPSDVASFISGHRLGERDKMSFLVLDRQLRVVANFFTDEVEVNTTNAQELAKDMLAKAITHGGEGIIVYGRFKTWGLTGLRTLGNLIKAKSGGNVNLIEAITIKDGDTYESAAEEGVLEAETKYTAESKPMSKSDLKLPATISIDGIERSTTNSEGKPIAQTEEGVRNFWQWFGDSKVVDAEGRPLVVYHGTNKEFNSFKEGTQYFTVNKNEASGYAKERSNGLDKGTPNIISAYLKIVNPAKDDDIIAAAEQAGVDPDSDITSALANIKEVKTILEKRGFDGIGPVLDLGFESDFDEFETYATFNANQIKSATNNTGTFDPNNNDMRFRTLEQSNQELPATINIDGIERSTTNSEGKPIHSTEEGVRNFWRWFGDSKVVDNEGRPLVVYHATQSDFNEFETQKIGTSVDFGTLGSGFYFTTSAENANNYAKNLSTNTGKQSGESIMPVYLKINNPYDAQQLREVSGDSKKESENFTNKNKKKGHDGVKFEQGSDFVWYVAYNPNQIKSATGNTGAFDPNNNDIRFRHEDSKDVTLFKYGEGGTKGVFTDSKGNLYKSLTRQENVYDNETKSFSKRDVPGETNEYEILKELQDNRNIVKVRNKVDTKQGPMFEMETLNEVDRLTYNEYNEIKNILKGINDQGYFVNDFVTVMRRPETNELVIVDFSSGLKNKSLIGNPNYDDRRNMSRLKDLLTKEDRERVEIDDHNENERRLAKYFPGYEPDIRFRTVDEAGFYSTVESALEGIKQNKGTPQQFKAMLLKNGAKQAELDWMDYDGTFTGKSVTKTEIQDWIDQNRIKIEEVNLTLDESERERKIEYEYHVDEMIADDLIDIENDADVETRLHFGIEEPIYLDESYYLGDADEETMDIFAKENGYEDYNDLFNSMDSYLAELREEKIKLRRNEYLSKYKPNNIDGIKQYENWKLPGGANYRELLLTLPNVKADKFKQFHSSEFYANNPIFVHIRFDERTIRVDNPDYKENFIPDFDKEYELIDNGGSYQVKRKSESTPFVNSYSKKILADNNMGIQELKTYLMEKTELGKTHPDAISNKRKRFKTEKVLFIEEIQSDWAQEGKKKGFKSDKLWNEADKKYADFMNRMTKKYGETWEQDLNQQELDEESLLLKARENASVSPIPDMPFKKTDQWVNLALRRMMRYAAENDFDRIAWTTGEQQVERYDLSKQVDWIEYGKNENGTYWFVLPVEYSVPSELTEQELESYVGEDIAKKMIEGEGVDGEYGGKRLQGNDLKVGGKGMIAFYNQIVPKAAKKLGKPFGANVEVVELPETGQQLSIPVTEKMKESVQEGVPLFRTVSDAAESAGSNMTEELRKEYDRKYNKFATRFREAWEDMYLPVKQFLDVLRENGVEVEEYNDFYKQATFTSGKNDAQLDYFRKTFQKPITEQISNLQKLGFKYRDIENYVFAKHGLERNDFMAKQEARDRYAKDIQDLQKDYKDGNIGEEELEMGIDAINLQIEDRYEHLLETKDYSGITALEEEFGKTAEEYIAEFEEKAEEENIAKLWNAIKKATDYTLERQYKSGRINKGTYDELKARYKNFVPLRGHDAETAEDRWDYTPDMGTYYTEPLIKAKGRRTRAESPFAYIEQMAHSAITWGNKNELKQTLLRLARKDTKGLMSVSQTWFRNMGTKDNPVWEQVSAEYSDNVEQYLKNQRLFEEQMQELKADGMAYQGRIKNVDVGGLFIKPKQAEQHEIRVNQNGVDYTIYINGNPAVARAVNGSNRKDISKSLGVFSNVTRNMAANFTTRNPLFVMTNFSRDYIFASTILMAKESPAYAVRFQRNIPGAMGSLQRYVRGKLDLTRPNDLMMYEYIMNGAKTGFSNIFELDRVAKKLKREATKGTKKKNALDYGRAILDGIDALNEMAENMSRLAVYMTSRKEGRSITQSVHDAKNVTVNFNQKGAGTSVAKNPFEAFIFNASSYVRPLFLFTNAAIQALSNVAKNFAKNPVGMAKIVSSYAIVGFLNPLLLSLIGSGEAEDDYMKLSDWERQNNWCIWLPSGFIKIPLPHELRVFHRIGDNIYQAVFKNKDIFQTLLDTAMSFSDLLPMNPMGSVDTSWAEIIPDAARPFAQIATNTNFMGSRVYDQWASKSEPGYLKARTNKKGEPYAPQFMIDLFKSIDHALGGDGVKKGLISPNPDIVNHLLRGYFGGLYTLSEQGIGIAAKTYEWTKTGEFKLKVRETPLRTFYADANDLNIQGSGLNTMYFKVSDDVIERKRRIKRYSEQLVNGEITNDVFQEKLKDLNVQAVNEINEYIKTIKKYESALSDMSREEQKDAEKIISDLKKTVIELGNGI